MKMVRRSATIWVRTSWLFPARWLWPHRSTCQHQPWSQQICRGAESAEHSVFADHTEMSLNKVPGHRKTTSRGIPVKDVELFVIARMESRHGLQIDLQFQQSRAITRHPIILNSVPDNSKETEGRNKRTLLRADTH
ncbi:hypothetical protein BJ165DRAFT_427385 [Panaeolus papilionaceus]|nr:hypothetical protein BJ165DRAFT_427385 [Panaeolus papilionaceus]